MPKSREASDSIQLSRRSFLGAAAAAVGGRNLFGASTTDDNALDIPNGTPLSRVIQVQSPHALDGADVHRQLFREMLDASLIAVTNQKTVERAWKSILSPDDIVGLKFNRSGQAAIATTKTVAEVIVGSLVENGWPAKRIVCIETPSNVEATLGTTQAWSGFEPVETDFGSGADHLARFLSQVTAIIDVPFLKTHNIAGLTCSLKNLSHGLIRHPARYHSNGCSPYIADIVAIPTIRDKLRLCLVDGLRVMYDGGPAASASMLSNEGILLASRDPVAIDAVGLVLLNNTREKRGLPKIAEAPEDIAYLAEAHRRNLGIALRHGIEHVRIMI